MTSGTASETQATQPKQAGDVMTSNVISVGPDEPIQEVAKLLLDHAISAVPVVNSDGVPIGMVSEGDLIGRGEEERQSRYEWWLGLMTGRQRLDEEFQTRLLTKGRTARDVMTSPVVTVTEQTGVNEIARLLAIHRIKRVPVVRDSRLVGIVSRADLLRVVAASQPPAPSAHKEEAEGFLSSLFSPRRTPPPEAPPTTRPAAAAPERDESALVADNFRHLVEDFHSGETQHQEQTRRAAAQHRRQQAKDLINAHMFDESWRSMLHRAREAAENGQTEYLLLRFPGELCTDGGRAINVAEPNWPATLRGEPAEIYLRWERELKRQGFSLSARVLEYPGGKPGDIGLFLVWAT